MLWFTWNPDPILAQFFKFILSNSWKCHTSQNIHISCHKQTRLYMFWFNFILGLNSISLCFWVWQRMKMSLKQTKIKFNQLLNHNMYVIYTPERFIQKSSGFNFGAFLFFSLGFQAHSSPEFKNVFDVVVRFLLCFGTYFLTDKAYFVITDI